MLDSLIIIKQNQLIKKNQLTRREYSSSLNDFTIKVNNSDVPDGTILVLSFYNTIPQVQSIPKDAEVQKSSLSFLKDTLGDVVISYTFFSPNDIVSGTSEQDMEYDTLKQEYEKVKNELDMRKIELMDSKGIIANLLSEGKFDTDDIERVKDPNYTVKPFSKPDNSSPPSSPRLKSKPPVSASNPQPRMKF